MFYFILWMVLFIGYGALVYGLVVVQDRENKPRKEADRPQATSVRARAAA
ncbi:MAG: hypothetical protein IPK87_08700 [Planctomycetes bacterium]|nr:hypothetical protein [Planctomycetota bacterium]